MTEGMTSLALPPMFPTTSAKVFREDWRIYLVFPRYLPADVHLEGEIRWIRPSEST